MKTIKAFLLTILVPSFLAVGFITPLLPQKVGRSPAVVIDGHKAPKVYSTRKNIKAIVISLAKGY